MKVIGISAGNGVNLHPFHLSADFEVLFNIETRATFHTKCSSQWKSNFGDIPLFRSVKSFRESSGSLNNTDIDIIIGNPDCGHSSVLSYSRAKKFGDAKTNDSLNTFIESVNYFRPKIFLMENLPALLKQITKEDFKRLYSGYKLEFIIASVMDFGNSQETRERLLIIGTLEDTDVFKNIYQVSKPKFSEDLIRGLNIRANQPELCHVREPDSTVVCMEWGFKKMNLKQIRKAWSTRLKDQKNWDATQTGKGTMKTLPGVYRNLRGTYPRTARKQNRQFNHLGYMMTPRELARIQGIPDDFVIFYDPNKSGYWINKGRVTVTKTPPYEIGVWFKERCEILNN